MNISNNRKKYRSSIAGISFSYQTSSLHSQPRSLYICLTHPRISTPRISPHASPRKKMLCGDAWGRPHKFPTQNVDFFFIPTKGLLLTIHQNPHPHAIPTQFLWIFTQKLLIHAQFTFENCAPHTKKAPHSIPTQSAMFGTRPHAKFWPGVGLWDRGVFLFLNDL